MSSVRTLLRLGVTLVAITLFARPVAAQTTISFDSVDLSVDGQRDASAYVASFGASLANVTPGTSVVLQDNSFLYSGAAAIPATPPNLLTQVGSNDPVSFTLVFPTPLTSVTFTRLFLLAGSSGITHPQWSAHALDSSGRELSTAGEGLISSFSNVPAKTFTLSGPRIAAVRFDSNNLHFAAFAAVLIDNLVLNP